MYTVLWSLFFGREEIYSETANTVKIKHTAGEQQVLLFPKACPSPGRDSDNETRFCILKWNRTHRQKKKKKFSQNTAITLTLHIKEDAWTLLDQNDFKDVSINCSFTKWL